MCARSRISDEALVAKMDAMDDHDIIALLNEGDDDAWHYVELKAVFPMLKSPRLGRIAQDRGLPPEEVSNAVFELLFTPDKKRNIRRIELFEFRCPFVYWVRNWVSKVILGYVEKFDNPVSSEVAETVLKDKAAKVYDLEGFEVARKCFRRLWKENRLKASVHYLKVVSELSSREVMKLLHLSSEANVNQIFSRACKDMRRFRQELETPNLTRMPSVTQGKEVVDELS